MNTNEVCRNLNLTVKSLIVYESYGIVVPKREKNNYRNYNEEDLNKLRTVILLRELGFSLKDIKKLMDKSDNENQEFTRGLYLQLKAVERKIFELNNVKDTLINNIDKLLEADTETDKKSFLDNVDISIKDNRTERMRWIDMLEFDNKAVKFDKMVRDRSDDELGLFEKYDEVLSLVREKITKSKAKTVVDIGCGTGNLCGELSSDIDILGIDQSLEMILQAKKKYKHLKFKLGNFLDKPIEKSYIDVLVSTYAFHGLTCDQKKEALKNMMEYIKDDGKIIIADFMFSNNEEREKCRKNLLAKGRKDLWEVIEYKHYTNLDELKAYVYSLNYKIYSEHIVNFTWMVEIEKNKQQKD